MRVPRLPLLALVLALVASAAPAQAQRKPTVAILYFDYDGSDEQMGFLRKGLTQMLVSDLTAVPEVDIIERVRLEDALAELELNRSKKIDRNNANRIGKLLGARYLVMGGYFDIAGTLRVDARVVEVETGKVVASMGKHGQVQQFLALEQHLAAALEQVFRTQLKLPKTGRKRPKTGRKARPKAPKALNARQAATYGKALDAIDRGQVGAARSILQGLVKETPDFQMAALDLASLAR